MCVCTLKNSEKEVVHHGASNRTCCAKICNLATKEGSRKVKRGTCHATTKDAPIWISVPGRGDYIWLYGECDMLHNEFAACSGLGIPYMSAHIHTFVYIFANIVHKYICSYIFTRESVKKSQEKLKTICMQSKELPKAREWRRKNNPPIH